MSGKMGVDPNFLIAMHHFREWAVSVATVLPNSDWVTPIKSSGEQKFAFSLEAYNFFAKHSSIKLKSFRKHSQLSVMLKKHAEHLYKDEPVVMLEGTNFFILPDKITVQESLILPDKPSMQKPKGMVKKRGRRA